MTGFRLAPGGAQERFGIDPDLSTFAKIAGGGLPLGAFGGKRELMSQVAPEGPVYQAGTLSGNPLAVAAGLATLRALGEPGVYERLEQTSAEVERILVTEARAAGIPFTLNRVGSMWTLFFCEGPVFDYKSAKRADTGRFARFFHAMLQEGVYLPPSQFESCLREPGPRLRGTGAPRPRRTPRLLVPCLTPAPRVRRSRPADCRSSSAPTSWSARSAWAAWVRSTSRSRPPRRARARAW